MNAVRGRFRRAEAGEVLGGGAGNERDVEEFFDVYVFGHRILGEKRNDDVVGGAVGGDEEVAGALYHVPQLEGNFGVQVLVLHEGGGECLVPDAGGGGDLNEAGVAFQVVPNRFEHQGLFPQNVLGMVKKETALFGEADGMALSDKEGDGKILFQLPQQPEDVARFHREFDARFLDASAGGDGAEDSVALQVVGFSHGV